MAQPALKRKPSGIYFLDLRKEGLGRVSLETRDRATALERRREYALGKPLPSSPEKPRISGNQVTMRELFDRAQATVWHPSQAKSQATIRSNVKILNAVIGDEPVSAMTYSRLEQLATDLKAMGYAPGTVKRKMDAVSKVLRMATKWTDENGKPLLGAKPPMPSIKVKNTKDRVLSYAEEAQVFASIEARRQKEPGRPWRRYGILIRFLLDTGGRLGESLMTGPGDLTVVPVDDDGNTATLVTFGRYRTKNDKPRSVPLTSETERNLRSLENDLAIRTYENEEQKIVEKKVYFGFKEATAWYMWSNLRDDLAELGFDIGDVTLHTLRHTCLTRLAQGGMELLRLQKWAGHSDPKITAERYVHLRVDDLLSGLDILQSSNGGNHANVNTSDAGGKRAGDGTISLQ